MIERRNILELIGKNRGKYHSCVLTCYSLDFSFFEERVLPVLRNANIKNVNVLADGKFLEIAQEHTTGKEFRHNKTYNFQPVYMPGVFHPKIMLLTGVKHGLLIIGSGNITSSGLNTNDEIWGAFHLDNIENENAPLFADVWEYLQQYLSLVKGFATQKIDWIKKYSPWLENLTRSKGEINIRSLNQSLHFICNSSSETISGQLQNIVPKRNIETITIISPYYDLNGEFITDLYDHYKPKKFNCVLDVEFGLLPKEIGTALKNFITFLDWKDCKSDYKREFYRLHAKIFHFEYTDGSEYLMLGSANATSAAMGVKGKGASNSEAGVIIQRRAKNTLLKELGVKLPKNKTVDISKVESSNSTLVPKDSPRKLPFKILYTELRGNELTIYFKEKYKIDATIRFLSHVMVELESVLCQTSEDSLTIACQFPEDVFKVCLINETGDLTSNYSIVHRFDYLLKCNPDPQQEKLDLLLDQEFVDGEGYTELLQFVDSNWADDEYGNALLPKQNRFSGNSLARKDEPGKNYETLSPNEFNKVGNEVLLKQAGEITSANVKIADFLQIVGSEAFRKSDGSIFESEEQRLLEDTDQKGEGSNVGTSLKVRNMGHKEKRAISNFLKKLNKQYEDKLDNFLSTSALTESPNEEISIKNLSNALIALQLIQLYWGKKYTVEEKVSNETTTKEEIYLLEGSISTDCDTVKGFMIDTFGKFLLIATGKFKEYEYDVLNQKLTHSRKQIFYKSIFIILNINWNESESVYKNTLLLNSLYFLNPLKMSSADSLEELSVQIEKMRTNAKYITNAFENNRIYFFKNIFPQYHNWIKLFESQKTRETLINGTDTLFEGSYIFNSKIGFNKVFRNNINPEKYYLSLIRAGYYWSDEKEACVLEKVEYPKKCILYN